jgi:hypothetical protein
MKNKSPKKFNYTLIFGGRSSIEARIDTISEEYLEVLRETPEDELFEKALNDNYGDEARIYGINAQTGYIEVFNRPKGKLVEYEKLGKPLITLRGDRSGSMTLEMIEPSPQPDSLIVGCVINQDGIMGHIDLELDSSFNPVNLTVVYMSGEAFVTDSAITGIKYRNGKNLIEASIDETCHTNLIIKDEIFYCSRFDHDLNEVPLFENKEWVD